MKKLLESELSQQVTDYLRHRGWRLIRMNRGLFSDRTGHTVQFGEPGMADYLALHYRPPAVIWIEMKRSAEKKPRCICLTKKPRQRCTACDQAAWQLAERARGGTVWVIDGIDRLVRCLEASGHAEETQRQVEMRFPEAS